MDVLGWLLGADPAVCYQALRDLTDTESSTLAAARTRIAREGIAADIRRAGPYGFAAGCTLTAVPGAMTSEPRSST